MNKKLNYLALLLMTIFIVGCTNEEDLSNTNAETVPQEVATINTNKISEKEEAGALQTPRILPFSTELSKDIKQYHSSHYKNPSQLTENKQKRIYKFTWIILI